jgi:lysophospholipase L1-like esterase
MTDRNTPSPAPRLNPVVAGILTTGFVLVLLFATALVVEAYLGSRKFNGYCVFPQNLKYTFSPMPGVMTGISGDSRFTTNKYGMRGRNPSRSDDYSVLTIGGSTTECLFLDDTETWAQLLEDRLGERAGVRVWVGNAGKSGLNTRHHVVETDVLLSQMPDVDAVVLLVGINDLSFRLSWDEQWRMAMPSAVNRDVLIGKAFWVRPEPETVPVYKFPELRYRLRVFKGKAEEDEVVSSPIRQDANGQAYLKWRENRRTSPYRRDQMPDLRSALREYAANINAIIDIASARSVDVVFAAQPTIWKAHMPEHERELLWMGGVGRFQAEKDKPYYTPAILDSIMGEYNDTLRDVCTKRGVICVDLPAVIPKDTSAVYDDCHFNENGARLVADAIADRIFASGLLSSKQ